MAVIKCKMCGGDLEIKEGLTVAECEYCGSRQTIPTADNEKKLTLFGRAGRLLRGCEFDKAAGVFESIVADFPEEAEAYWGLVLCKYGIEYVDDPATGKKIPTCHRSSFDSVLDDANFEQACENTDAVARRVYRDEARAIEELRKNIIEVSGKEEPYDVFISYKETDEHGERTLDSVIAQDIYKELTNEGYRVFFSRISLEDKQGTEYEPYIFAALNSAKVMLVVGTDYENFDAVWVKNEWSRFLALIASGQKKTLIPCYKNMDAYDMPKEFAKLAAQDMGKVGAMQDLVRGVEKIVGKKKAEPVQAQPVQQVVQQTVVQGGGPNVQALLKRGHQALEDGDWAKAKGFYDQVLSMDAENADAFLGLALAGQQVRDLRSYFDTLSPGRVNVETDTLECDKAHIARSIAQAVVPGYCEGSELKKLYDFTVAYPVKSREETAATQQIKSRFNGDRNLSRAFRYAQGETKQKLETLKNELFDTLDKRVRAAETSDKKALEEAKSEFAAKLEAADRRAEEMSRTAQEKREADYQEACRQAEIAKDDFEFTNAGVALKRVGKYKDADERARECEQKAAEIKASREQAEREAKEKAEAAQRKKNRKAGIIFGSVAVAVIAIFLLVTQVIVPANRYAEAHNLMEKCNYEAAFEAFDRLGNYKDSMEQARAARYSNAQLLAEDGRYYAAALAFQELGDYRDASGRSFELWGIITDRDTISANYAHTVGLKNDGTVVAVGYNEQGQCKVDQWTDIVAVSTGAGHTVGLRYDGTVVAVGHNMNGQCDVDAWTDIVSVSAGYFHTVGIKKNGTVIAVGRNSDGQCNVIGWTDIVAVSANDSHTVGLKYDGTVIATGDNTYGQCNVGDWSDIVAISAGEKHTVGLKSDGTVVAVGYNKEGQCNIGAWKDIVAISTSLYHTVGLKSDGTVMVTKKPGNKYVDYGQFNVGTWTDIVAITTGPSHTVGLRKDGSVIATKYTGDEEHDLGQCNVSGWNNIKLPKSVSGAKPE